MINQSGPFWTLIWVKLRSKVNVYTGRNGEPMKGDEVMNWYDRVDMETHHRGSRFIHVHEPACIPSPAKLK